MGEESGTLHDYSVTQMESFNKLIAHILIVCYLSLPIHSPVITLTVAALMPMIYLCRKKSIIDQCRLTQDVLGFRIK